ncbi:hypothetical protein [Flavobacterium cellulosilyticum]|uniref:Uncharacterized protein n=1 Tax=Flavobacterium cellulosilyticum TaxID=2541731 RepID=A0A4R5CI13_9FLAO|nr:hypothetical protein [Flavobacterium cellulosilyticum]TDD99858.1 hypothetical protein E0F76_03815 [Flavobacterium cellulosilyticum]
MKKTFLRKLLLGFSTILLFVYGVIFACGGGEDWGWFFDSNFAPETFVDKSYSPLFLSQEVFYGIGFDTEHTTRFNDENSADWTTFLGDNIPAKDLTFFLTDSSSADVKGLTAFFKYKKTNKFSVKWKNKIKLNDSKTKDFILFLKDVQEVEHFSTQKYDSWNYDAIVKPAVLTNLNWIKSMEKKYAATNDPFLKNRYWFLVIKTSFYSTTPEFGTAFFYNTQKDTPKNTLYYRALAYQAGIEYQQKHFAKSNYLYSQVFDKCPSLRVVSAYSFHPQEEKDWKESLNMAKSDEEKAALWAIQGYYTDEEQAIAEIYKIQPKSEHLDYLLTRLINNQENKIDHSFKQNSVLEYKKRTKDSISKSSINLVLKIAQSNQTAKPYLWNVAAGYLETLNGNIKQAEVNFDNAESKMPQTSLAISQVRLLRFVNNLSKIDQIDSNNEKTILKDLTWLYDELPKLNIENLRYENATTWSKNYLSALYKSQKNEVLAELFVRDNSFYDNEKKLEAMKTFLAKNNKTAIEKIGVSVYNVNLVDINNYQAVAATFANKIPEAIAFMQKTEDLQNVKFYGNPFNGYIKDCHDCEHAVIQKKKYSKIDFLNTLKIMQDNISNGEEVYSNSLLLGNAFYNITHFGNARIFHETNINGYGYSPYDFRDPIRAMVTDCSLAKMYYKMALEATTNREQKAKCYYMIAKCERNEYYNVKYKLITNANCWKITDDKINFLAWDGFKKLKANYSDTKYYQEVVNECGYFKTYISQK